MRSPNAEQQKAIAHHGGVLLNAGAGSGKTFVLIEHIHFLVEEFFKSNSNLTTLEQANLLKIYLGKKVLMTFTNDAAAEIKERLVKRFKDFEGTEKSFVIKCLDALNVSTIHGFCLKLIKSGLIEGVETEFEISDEFQINYKVEMLTKKWFHYNESHLSDLMFKNYKSLVRAMQFVFSSPELRLQWLIDTENETTEFDQEDYFLSLFDALEAKEFWQRESDLSGIDEKEQSKSWYILLSGINNIKSKELSWETIQDLKKHYDSIARITTTKKVSDELKADVEMAKSIKAFIKKNYEDLEYFFTHQDSFAQWQKTYQSLFSFVNNGYSSYPGFSFADLEFFVLNSLRTSEKTREQVSQAYDYLIVDEYQDTSWIQFEIIKYVINDDFKKLFCVGDRKQAIYGFRGGELGVFNQTSEQIPQNLLMSNNYRSEEVVVDFNNKFFDHVFKLGPQFKGSDAHTVAVDYQTFPSEVKEEGKGKISIITHEIEDESVKRQNPTLLNATESQILLSRIKKILADTDEEICILYKNLAPSKDLIQLLIEEKIAFQAQVKVQYNEDPIITIFSAYVDFLLDYLGPNRGDLKHWSRACKYFNFYLSSVTSHFFNHSKSLVESELKTLVERLNFVGLEVSFLGLLFHLGLSNSSYDNNLRKVANIINGSNGDLNSIWQILQGLTDKSYSTKISFLDSPRVLIMTSHASKGLQYDHIFLGGIHTNGRKVANKEIMGRLPGSYRWSSGVTRKKLHKSPLYIYENLVRGLKDFSESKRLLYVAATRAVKSISWVDLKLNGKDGTTSPDSWINGLRTFQSEMISVESYEEEGDQQIVSSKMPIFFKDPLGITGQKVASNLGIVAELSVTKLAIMVLCPTKFYLSQVLKLDEQWQNYADNREIEVFHKQGISDADRGTKVHHLIEKMVKGSYVSGTEFDDILTWVKLLIDNYPQESLISENEIKFSFFGQMITGIPDLIIKDKEVEIWDFKTGLCDEDDKRSYFFQLMTYAYGVKQVFGLTDDSVRLKLIMLDQKEVIEKVVDLKTIEKQVFMLWQKLNKIDREPINHCSSCQYGNLCHLPKANSQA
jgi:ATP-dependent helicase/nuclease subunit A